MAACMPDAAPALRHNRGVAHDPPPRYARVPVLMLLALVAACGNQERATDADAGDAPGAPLVWQGLVACADCAGIDTRLRLERASDGTARYQLVEAFLDGGGAEYYREEGRWERAGRILTLRAATGGVRRYRLDGEGRLLAADRTGREAGSGGPLSPVAASDQGL